MKPAYTYMITDDNALLREGLKSLLAMNTDYECIAEASNGAEALSLISREQPDFVLMDLSMPELNGFEVINMIRRRYPDVKIMVLSVLESDEAVLQALKNGAHGYCNKNSSYEELQGGLRSMLDGNQYISRQMKDHVMVGYLERSKKVKSRSDWETITRRERQVLTLIAEGYKNSAIAENMSISIKTVEKHRANLMKKLGLNNTTKLTAYAIGKNLINTEIRTARK
jgi:DNA-binding NarL/FixJ family response regulator